MIISIKQHNIHNPKICYKTKLNYQKADLTLTKLELSNINWTKILNKYTYIYIFKIPSCYSIYIAIYKYMY